MRYAPGQIFASAGAVNGGRVEAGYVWLNSNGRYIGAPYGGWKQSGIGEEECFDEILSYTQIKKHQHEMVATPIKAKTESHERLGSTSENGSAPRRRESSVGESASPEEDASTENCQLRQPSPPKYEFLLRHRNLPRVIMTGLQFPAILAKPQRQSKHNAPWRLIHNLLPL
jgi:hypothetical protein